MPEIGGRCCCFLDTTVWLPVGHRFVAGSCSARDCSVALLVGSCCRFDNQSNVVAPFELVCRRLK